MNSDNLQQLMYQTLLELSTEQGINASGKDDVYGCIFGRDSAITILTILQAISRKPRNTEEKSKLLAICKRGLLTLTQLQGNETNVESGEEPGKFIHEYRTDKYERLLAMEKPWYVYPDGILRNYDSIDATPLALIAIHMYWKQTHDDAFLVQVLPSVEKGLNWLITYADKDKDNLIEYELSPLRNHGGLVVQSWTDSTESLLQLGGEFPLYPIAPVEVQGYAWLALKLWGEYYSADTDVFSHTKKFGKKLLRQAEEMKKQFNALFLTKDANKWYPVQALDGQKNKIATITGNPLLLLWAGYNNGTSVESILDERYISDLVERAFMPDLFDLDAGIRTMSLISPTYIGGQNSYHNGSFWPKLNGMSHQGLEKFGFSKEAGLLRNATLKPLVHFGSAIELYIKTETGEYLPYSNPVGQQSCRQQAWSAAVAYDLLNF